MQQWFRGVHSDIGGGFAAHGLSDVTLLWMEQEAQTARVSLGLSKEVGVTGIPITPNPSQAPNTNTGFTSWFTTHGRTISLGDLNNYIDANAFCAAYLGIL